MLLVVMGDIFAAAAAAPSNASEVGPPCLFMDCHANRIFPSGSNVMSLNTADKASFSTWVRVFVPLAMSLDSILPESSNDRITFGATYGCFVPGGAVAMSMAQPA
ncbi:hypothetical protein D3C72_1402460 [compost metagenome]